MSKSNPFLNRSTLYITSGVLRQDQVTAAFGAAFTQIRAAYPDDPEISKATYEVNVVSDTRGKLFGVAYVWVASEKVYNILIGLNPDGTERVGTFPDPEWKEPSAEELAVIHSEERQQRIEELTAARAAELQRRAKAREQRAIERRRRAAGKFSWADISEEEDDEETRREEDKAEEARDKAEEERDRKEAMTPVSVPKYTPYVPTAPMLTRKLDPIVRLPAIKHTADQVLAVARELREKNLTPFVQEAGKYIDYDPDSAKLEEDIALTLQRGGREVSDEDINYEVKRVRDALIQIRDMRALFIAEEKALVAETTLTTEATPENAEKLRIIENYKRLQAEYPEILTDVPRFGHMDRQRSFTVMPSPDEDPRTLCCRTAPNWITEDLMHVYFDKFNTDKRVYEKKVHGKQQRIRYPLIRVNENPGRLDFEGLPQKMVYVTFSESPDHQSDAPFCLQMRRKFTVEADVIVDDETVHKTAQLIFSHWRYGQKGVPGEGGHAPSGGRGGRGGYASGGRGRPPPSPQRGPPPARAQPSGGRGLPPPASQVRGAPTLPPRGGAWRTKR